MVRLLFPNFRQTNPIQAFSPTAINNLILFSPLDLSVPSCIIPWWVRANTLDAYPVPARHATCPAHPIFHKLVALTVTDTSHHYITQHGDAEKYTPLPPHQRATDYQRTTTEVQRASDFMVYVIPNLVSTGILNVSFNQVFNPDINIKCP
jgi:hypothetical protein